MSGHDPRTIDVHAHHLPAEVVAGDIVEIGSFQSRPIPRMLTDLDVRLDVMERQGVDMQVLSGWTELLAYDLPVGLAAGFARRHNAAMAASVAQHAASMVGLATVPLQDPTVAAEVLEEAVQLGLPGVQIGTHVAGTNLDDPRLEPFWESAERLRVLVLIHPAQSNVAGKARLGAYYFENLIGNPFETALAGAHLIFGGVLERHPGLKVCLAHGGGFLPYQLGRLTHGYRARDECRERLTEGVEASFGRLHFDTILHHALNLQHLVTLVGADRVLLGSDYPFDMGEDAPLASVRSLGLPPDQLELLRGGNARRLLAR